jgi:Uma2 family endonuclease
MASVLEAPPQTSVSQRFLLHGVSWQTYKVFARELEGRPALRLTYDGEDLELMTLTPKHERLRYWAGRVVDMLCWELRISIGGGGAFTHQRDDIERGFEPDIGYWIQSQAAIRGRTDIDLTKDPPLDLAIEIEVSRSVLDRLAIYAAFGIREVWRFNGETLRVYLPQPDGTYQASESSAAFPFLPMDEFAGFLQLKAGATDTEQLEALVDRIRERDFASQL